MYKFGLLHDVGTDDVSRLPDDVFRMTYPVFRDRFRSYNVTCPVTCDCSRDARWRVPSFVSLPCQGLRL